MFLKKKYLVVYNWFDGFKNGIGNVDVRFRGNINLNRIRDIEKQIIENTQVENVVIINLIKL